MAKRPYKWIGKTEVKKRGHKGALHRMLGYRKGAKIPTSVLIAHQHDTGLRGQRVRFALNVRRLGKKRRARHARSR